MMFIPDELDGYIRFENGKVIAVKPIPEELQQVFDEFAKEFEKHHTPTIRVINTK